jgi:exodeoxyribonuclease VII large subunit
VRQAGAALEAQVRLCHALAPQRLLERGFSITRDGEGAIVRDPRSLRIGDLITSELAAGSLRSRVEET